MSTSVESVTKPKRGLITAAAILIVIVVSIVVVAMLTPRADDTQLSPNSNRASGTGALAAILEAEGISVSLTHSMTDFREAARPDVTLVLPARQARFVQADVIADLKDSGARIVILGEENAQGSLDDWGLAGYLVQSDEGRPRAMCDNPDAVASAGIGPISQVYISPDAGCFPHSDGYAWVQSDARNVELISDASSLTNAELANPGNAAFAMRRLGAADAVVWLDLEATESVSPTDPGTTSVPRPTWYAAAGLALALAFAWFAIYRGRRFGKLVAEPLPVVVPAHESDLGRARLYQRGRSHGHAAQALRAGAIDRLIGRGALRASANRSQIVAALSSVTGRPPGEVDELFYTRPITSDTDLMNLATDLDAILKEKQ